MAPETLKLAFEEYNKKPCPINFSMVFDMAEIFVKERNCKMTITLDKNNKIQKVTVKEINDFPEVSFLIERE